MSGNQIGPYKLGKTLGVGSFSKVKIATHESTQQRVAIKILNRQKLKSMDMAAKVSREIKILRLFSHPHIIRLYEVIDTPTDIFVVMEFVPNGELFEYIVTRGRLAEDEARKFFQQIVCGLEYCHSHMVVHRDLKPENLLLDSDNNVKLADFGLSNMMRDGHFLSTSCGSPNYAAPEVISGNLYAGPEVDVWSCGVILYALLCGSLPFDDDNIPNLFRKIKSGNYSMPSYLSDVARDLIPKMLVVDPMKRSTLSQIRKHPWFLKNLPQYLAHIIVPTLSVTKAIGLHASEAVHEPELDPDVLAEMILIGFDKAQLISALALGPDLLTDVRFAAQVEAKKVAVAYHLLRDKKRRLEQDHNPISAADYEEKKKKAEAGSSIGVRSPMLSPKALQVPSRTGSPRSHAHAFAAINLLSPHPQLSAAKEKAVSRRWFVGIWTACDPATIMADLFRALKQCDFEWKILSPYKLKIRRMIPSGDKAIAFPKAEPAIENPPANFEKKSQESKTETRDFELFSPNNDQASSSSNVQVIKMGLQLYKTPRNRYVLDVQKLFGETFIFMNLCSKLMMELRI